MSLRSAVVMVCPNQLARWVHDLGARDPLVSASEPRPLTYFAEDSIGVMAFNDDR
jgi:hypothetical protein